MARKKLTKADIEAQFSPTKAFTGPRDWSTPAPQGELSQYNPGFGEWMSGKINDWFYGGGKMAYSPAGNFETALDLTPMGVGYNTGMAIGERLNQGDVGGIGQDLAMAVVPGAPKIKGAVKAAEKKLTKAIVEKTRPVVNKGGGAVSKRVQTVKDPIRNAFPGIYQPPADIVAQANARLAPEDPALKQLFGVTRDDLFEMSKRKGNVPGMSYLNTAKNPKGSAAASSIMVPRNEQRLIAALEAARTGSPELYRGMHAWYTMDPMFQRMVELRGYDEAVREYTKLNTMVGMASPASEVTDEINRGSSAYMAAGMGRFEDWQKWAGMAQKDRGADFPELLRGVKGHLAHSTSHAQPMANYLRRGEVDMGTPKVPLYVPASGVPQTGFQTDLPVPDAHFTRAVGLPDVRTSQDYQVSMKMPEFQQLGPWWRDRVAGQVGLESVPGQAIAWGLYSPQTGVKSKIGAPKLELWAGSIAKRAKKLGMQPEKLRDLILMGKDHAMWTLPVAGAAGWGASQGAQEQPVY